MWRGTAIGTTVSIIIPVLNEEQGIQPFLQHLQPLRHNNCEVLMVDGGSEDNTVHLASGQVDKIISSAPGRAKQMNLGAEHAQGDILLFLHADTFLPNNVPIILRKALKDRYGWGRFDIALSNPGSIYKIIACLINLRSRLTSIAGGDQAIFIGRELFDEVGGYAPIALMEDIELCQRLKKKKTPICLKDTVISSSRRWEQQGVLKTIVTMWILRSLYHIGIAPNRLARMYGYEL